MMFLASGIPTIAKYKEGLSSMFALKISIFHSQECPISTFLIAPAQLVNVSGVFETTLRIK